MDIRSKMGVDSYSSLTQKQEDLLFKRYCYGAAAMVNLVSHSTKTYRARLSQLSDSTLIGSTSLEFKHKQLLLKPKLLTTGRARLNLDYEASKNLKIKGEVSAQDSFDEWEGVVSAEFQDEKVRAKVAVRHPGALQLTATCGDKDYGAGADLKYNAALGRLVTYNLISYWFGDNYRLVFSHKGSDKTKYAWGDFVYSYFHKTSDKTQVASCVTINWPKKSTYLEFGGVYQYADDTELRAKVDSNGVFSAGISKACCDSLRVSIATQLNAQKVASLGLSDYQLGLRLDFHV